MMSYKKLDFGKGLLDELEKGYDPVRIAKWAYTIKLDNEIDAGLYDDLMTVATMEAGPEFHLTENELRRLAARLIES